VIYLIYYFQANYVSQLIMELNSLISCVRKEENYLLSRKENFRRLYAS